MFDFRYHVASLSAVFLALIVGIVIGVGISGQGILNEGERRVLSDEIARLNADLDRAGTRLEEQQAAEQFVEAAYEAVMESRLAGKNVVVVYLGEADELRSEIQQAVTDADGTVARVRVLKLPVDDTALRGSVESTADFAWLVADGDVRALGRELGRELVDGGQSPLWDTVADQLVIERVPNADVPADAVVVVRTVEPQSGPTARFLNGLYGGLTGGIPVVWVDTGKEGEQHRLHPEGLTVLRDASGPLGRMSLAVLLATGDPGEYGPDASSVIPFIEPVVPPVDESG
jgi:hypothetical protein